MNIQVIGLNHKSAPIEIRERISFSPHKLQEAFLVLRGCDWLTEALILSTCDRVELYTVTSDTARSFQAAQDFISDFHKVPAHIFRDYRQ